MSGEDRGRRGLWSHARRRSGTQGHEGILEESPLEEMRRQFEVNVFGAVATMKAVLPSMREPCKGHIVNVTSMGGFITMPGIASYCGSKFALEGVTEALAKEVAPGSFRTDWAGRSMVRSERSIADYDALFDPVRAAREAKSGRQTDDPTKAAQALLLGSDALGREIDAWEEAIRSTDLV